jgi:NAD+ kinase
MIVKRLGVVVHGGKPAAVTAATTVWAWAKNHDIQVIELDVWSAPRLSATEAIAQAGDLDLIVAIGGDGTFLRGVAAAQAADAPVLGVDVGRLGFLTEVQPDDLIQALDDAVAGKVTLESRLTLSVMASRLIDIPDGLEALLRYGRGPMLPPPTIRNSSPDDVGWGIPLEITALNDIVFEKLSRDRQASLGLYIGNTLFMTYSADALVVSSPTGSTAYSFAAGGPIVSPRADVIIFTPVAAHMAFDRSLVLAADELITIRVLDQSGQVAMTVDGEIRGVLDPGDWVSVFAQRWRVKLIRTSRPAFFNRVRERFGLSDAPAALADGHPPLTNLPHAPVPDSLRHLHIPTNAPE